MIKVIRREVARNGRWEWRAEVDGGRVVRGRSRQPLLDACRALERMGVHPDHPVGLYREGRLDWDLRTTVGHGADRTVKEGPRMRFARYEEHKEARR
jgi:hypothetical protein